MDYPRPSKTRGLANPQAPRLSHRKPNLKRPISHFIDIYSQFCFFPDGEPLMKHRLVYLLMGAMGTLGTMALGCGSGTNEVSIEIECGLIQDCLATEVCTHAGICVPGTAIEE